MHTSPVKKIIFYYRLFFQAQIKVDLPRLVSDYAATRWKIDEQLLFATTQRDGQIYAPKHLINIAAKVTGERKKV
jgi:hypothetical protein